MGGAPRLGAVKLRAGFSAVARGQGARWDSIPTPCFRRLELKTMRQDDASPPRGSPLKFLLLLPYLALLWLPFYNDVQPPLLGFPFFYWYQFLWVPLTSLILYIVYRWVR
jgi:hypothetical protein